MIKITTNITNSVSPMLREAIAALSGEKREEINEAAGRAAVNAAVKYHREFDSSGGWKGPRYLGPSRGDGGSFGADVARGWFFMGADSEGAAIANHADHYAFKVTGGTITPKRAKALTIPLILEAKGYSGAASYQQSTGKRLFTIKGKNVLFERTDQVVSGARGRRGRPGSTPIKRSGLRAVYALMKSVTMGPWPGAVPDEDAIASAFVAQFKLSLEDIIKDL